MSKPITIAQTNLMDPTTAPAEIDRVLQACYVNSRPVYIQLPADMVIEEVDAKLLDTPVDVKPPQSDRETENLATEIILRKLYAAKRPTLLLDAGAQRHRVREPPSSGYQGADMNIGRGLDRGVRPQDWTPDVHHSHG